MEMDIFLITVALTNGLLGSLTYVRFYRIRYLISDRFGFTIASTASIQTSLVLSLNFYLLFPENLSLIASFNIISSMMIGLLFGTLINIQSLIAGIYHGGVASVMGTMAGIVALDPTICGLPASLLNGQTMTVYFSVLSLLLQVFTTALLTFSLRA
jgi:hypothetical protein